MSAKKILPPTYLLAALALMVALHLLLPGPRLLSGLFTLLGLVPLLAGVAINLVADGEFKRLGTTVKPGEESTTLVTTGVFRLSRNPMYLGFVLVLVGVALQLGTLTPWIVVLAFVVLMDVLFIRPEEDMLEETFGQAFLDYKRRTRRWL
ncbi:MAG: isoprenylcysteine carboxylmethyltransferase family protein [Chloroflexota bacterium]|jgi:protein-S-isoprenylcysteine O-methyltransferase Ste14